MRSWENKAKKVELLAPAGGMEAFRGALNAGADAVYLAGQQFGARAYAGNFTEEELEETLNALEGGYDYDRRGLRLLRFGRHVQLATRPDYAKYVEKLLQPVQKQSLSQAVMETLAVIAYRQPVTKAEIELIRGVKCDYSVQMLVSRGLIEEVGRKEALGRPILYGTTDAFLRHFCLTSLGDLPEIDFSALAEKIAEAEAKQASEAPKADPVDKLAQNIAKEMG